MYLSLAINSGCVERSFSTVFSEMFNAVVFLPKLVFLEYPP